MRVVSNYDKEVIIHCLRHMADYAKAAQDGDIEIGDLVNIIKSEGNKIYNHLHFDIYAGHYWRDKELC